MRGWEARTTIGASRTFIQSLLGVYYTEGQSLLGVYYEEGRSLCGVYCIEGQSLLLISPKKGVKLLALYIIFCQNPNSTNSSVQQSLRLHYILTER